VLVLVLVLVIALVLVFDRVRSVGPHFDE